MRTDIERLDWLESHQRELSIGQHNEDGSQIVVSLHSTELYEEWCGKTLRDAIDAAMNAALPSSETDTRAICGCPCGCKLKCDPDGKCQRCFDMHRRGYDVPASEVEGKL